MAQSKKIKLNNLLANTENYRFDTVANQREAIETMLENQSDNLFNLAEHIVKFGLNPNDRIEVCVAGHDKSKYIVLEGNRRTVALKILQNPEIIENSKYSNLKKKFKQLHEANKPRIPKDVECLIFKDPKEADIWIGLKHGYGQSGVITDTWGPLQKQRFQEKTEGKTSTSLQIIKLLKNSNAVNDEIKNSLDKISSTNLDRLIDDPDVRDFLGIEINSGILQSNVSQPEVVKGLTQIVKDILNPKFAVKDIYSKADRKKYLVNFPKNSRPNVKVKSAKPWQFNLPLSANASLTVKQKVSPRERKKLIPRTCVLRISPPKVNAIYHELMEIDVIKHPNAVAVLLRVFIELNVDSYLEAHSLATSLSAAKSGLDLQQKINITANHLETVKLADAAICKGIRGAVKDKNDILGIDTWHAYVHNNRFSPKSSNLIITWDNMQDFMIIVWNNIK